MSFYCWPLIQTRISRRRQTSPDEMDETCASSYSGLFPPLYGNVTSSTKPEVHSISHCRQRRTRPRPQVTCTKIWRNLDVVFEICERTDKRTDKQTDIQTIHHNTSQPIPGAKRLLLRPCSYIGTVSRKLSISLRCEIADMGLHGVPVDWPAVAETHCT